MTLAARCGIVYHDALGLEIDGGRSFGILGLLDIVERQQLGQRAEGDGKADEMAPRVVLLHVLDRVDKDGGIIADDEVGDGGPLDGLGRGADDVDPGGAHPADGAVEVEIHNDVHGLLGDLAQLLPPFADVSAEGSLHDQTARPERGHGGRGQGVRGGGFGLHVARIGEKPRATTALVWEFCSIGSLAGLVGPRVAIGRGGDAWEASRWGCPRSGTGNESRAGLWQQGSSQD